MANIYDLRVMGGLFGTQSLTASSSAIAVGSNSTVFVDNLGESTNSGVTQTHATGNFFGGQVRNGDAFNLFGYQIRAYCLASGNATTNTQADILEFGQKTHLELNLRGQIEYIGNLCLYPSDKGPGGSVAPTTGNVANGGAGAVQFRFPMKMPISLQEGDTFNIKWMVDTAVATSVAAGQYCLQHYFTASRARTFRALGGA